MQGDKTGRKALAAGEETICVTRLKAERQPFETSLGPVCEPHSSHWDLDLSDLARG